VVFHVSLIGSVKLKNFAWIPIIVAVIIGGCAETPQQRAQRLEPLLTEAGFHQIPADTPARLELLQNSPLKMQYSSKNGKQRYWFADPYLCQCLYVGNQKSYEKYEALKAELKESEKASERAEEAGNMESQRAYDEMIASPSGAMFYGD